MAQPDAEIYGMQRARKKFAAGANAATQRKQGETEIRKVVDGRTLRATGRTAQFNFRSRAELKTAVQVAAKAGGVTVAEWMERAIEAALGEKKR